MSDVADLEKFVKRYKELKTEIAKVIVGQEQIIGKYHCEGTWFGF